MRISSLVFKFILLLTVTLSSGAARSCYFVRTAEQAGGSETARYILFSPDSNPPAVLISRTNPAKHPGLNPKGTLVCHGSGNSGTFDITPAPSVCGTGALSFLSAAQPARHTLFSLSCLLTV